MADQSVLLAQETSVHDPVALFLHPEERLNHVLVLGMRTAPQQRVISNLIAQDIANGAGLAVIDTTGRFARPALDVIPPHRAHSAYYMRPSDPNWVIGFNPFRGVLDSQKALTAQHIVKLFKDIWDLDYERTPLLIDLLRSATRLLLDSDNSTLLGMYALLTNELYRKRLVERCTDALTRRFWVEFDTWPSRDRRDKPQPVLTRLRAFLSDPILRNVVGQARSTLDLGRVVREGQIFIADLDRTELGDETARLLACLLTTRLQIALESRTSGWPFYVYLPSAEQIHVAIAGRLIQGRYANAGVITAVSGIGSLDADVRVNLLSAETVVSYRVGSDDVRYLAPRFHIPQAEQNLLSLSPRVFAVTGYPHELTAPELSLRRFRQAEAIRRRSQTALGAKRCLVEKNIDRYIDNM